MATIYALSSGRPPAAIALIRTSGPEAFAAAEALAGTLPPPRQAALRRLTDAAGEILDEALVLVFPGPNSATGEDLVEFHCHGGRAVVDAVLAALAADQRLRLAEPGEFTRRAFANGRIDLTEAEGLADLLAAETESQRRAALANAGGALRRLVDGWRDRLVMLSAQAEAAIDYAGDEEETEVDGAQLAEAGRALALELDQWLAAPRTEGLRDGIRVVLAGPANAGKSSLLNALTGDDKAIVSATAGTTRDIIDVPIAINGVPLRLIDTAGLRESIDVVEAIGVQRAQAEVDAGDVLLWLGDPLETPDHPCVIGVHARSDEAGRPPAPRGAVACSAHTGEGLSELKLAIVHRASELLPGPDAVVLNRRQADRLRQCRDALMFGARSDIVLTAEALRSAREALDHVSGFSSVEDVLDALFGRFCLGK